MASADQPTQSLKCNKWVLKVPIHCVGCKRQVKKLLQSIDGVYTTSIDSQNQQVTVTGSIDSEILVKKLSKTGKHAEICTGKPSENNAKKTEKQISQNKEQTSANNAEKLSSNKKGNNQENKSPNKNNPQEKNVDKKGSDGAAVTETPSSGNSGKAKKGKGQKGNSGGDGNNGIPPAVVSTGLQNGNNNQIISQAVPIPVNLSPTFDHQLRPMMPNQGPGTVHVMSYNAAYPSKVGLGLSYPMPMSSPYISSYHANEMVESYQVQPTTFNTFDIFSDENPQGCYIM